MKSLLRILLFIAVVLLVVYVLRTYVPAPNPDRTPVPTVVDSVSDEAPKSLDICSFNIQFLGNSKERDNASLAWVLRECELVAIQELVAPPYPGTFPNGQPFKADAQSRAFFDKMSALGFEYVLSEEDTGTGDKQHINSSSTEWWVVFYRASLVTVARDLPRGFLASDRTNNPDYERVPYAFAFRTVGALSDFVLISVHLKPGDGPSERKRRKHELNSILSWIDKKSRQESDFIILGDMNFKNQGEIKDVLPRGWMTLNDEAVPTNTNIKGPKPYDHILFRPAHSPEIDRRFDFKVIDLIEVMRSRWSLKEAYPGDPYDHNRFRRYFSDHHPVMFRWQVSADDD